MISDLPGHIQTEFLQLLTLGKPGAAKALRERWLTRFARAKQELQEENLIETAKLQRYNLSLFNSVKA